MVIPTHIAEKGAAPSFREREETRRFYTETLLHTESFTHKHFYTQTLSHRDVFHAHTHRRISTQRLFTRKHFNTQTLLYTDSFTHIRFYMQMPFYRRTHTFTHKRFYTQTLLHTDTDAFTHRPFYTHTLLHTNTFTHIRFYTRTLLHANTFTYRHFYTQTLFHTDPFTHRRFYTQTLLHTDASTETFTQRRSQSAAPLGDLSCKQRCANIVTMEMLKNRKSAQDQAQYHDQRTIQCKASALLRYKISSAPWCRGWPQLPTQVGKHSRNGNAKKCKSTQTKAPYHGIQENLEVRARML